MNQPQIGSKCFARGALQAIFQKSLLIPSLEEKFCNFWAEFNDFEENPTDYLVYVPVLSPAHGVGGELAAATKAKTARAGLLMPLQFF